MILVRDSCGQWQECRALLDSGAEHTLISESCFNKLGLTRLKGRMLVIGVTKECESTRGSAILEIKSRVFDYAALEVSSFILSKLHLRIPSQGSENVLMSDEIILADPNYNVPKPIDIILGFAHVFNAYTGEFQSIGEIMIRKSIFGWIVGHNIGAKLSNSLTSTTLNVSIIPKFDELLQRFWELDDVPIHSQKTEDDENCEKIYCDTTKRTSSGRYCVKIPFKLQTKNLGNSHRMATHRFHNLEKRFLRDDDLRTAYVNVIREYVALGHMVKVDPSQLREPDDLCYYLPHHAVIKASSSTTKLRVVFDGSSKTSTGITLNDVMLKDY